MRKAWHGAVAALAVVLALGGCAGRHAARVRSFQQLPTLLTVADLVYQPAAYNRQEVTVEGWYRTGPRVAVLQPGFSYHGGTTVWVYDENREDEPTGPPLRDPRRKHHGPALSKRELTNQRTLDGLWGQTVHVVLEGEVRCGTFGHNSQYRCALFMDRVLAVGD